jgi:peptide/nickel transport system permease protein
MSKHNEQEFWTNVKRQYRQNKRAMIGYYVILFLGFIAIFASFIANDKPIFAVHEGKWMFPVVKDYFKDWKSSKSNFDNNTLDWEKEEFDFIIRTPIPYAIDTQDDDNSYVSPFAKQEIKSMYWHHWLGTSDLGSDILTVMIYGTRTALSIGLIAMSIASFIGILLGSLAGFFGDDRLFISRASFLLSLPIGFIAIFYAFIARYYYLFGNDEGGFLPVLAQWLFSIIIFFAIIGIGYLISKGLQKFSFFKQKVRIYVDLVISRIIEIFTAVPALIFILAFAAVFKNASIFNVMVIIGLITWTGIARLIRGELLRIRSLSYIEAARALGFSQWRTMFRHAIPNGLSSVLIAVAFGIATAILTEAMLSFLNISNLGDSQTWGGILNKSREKPLYWWLAVIPGFAIFVTVTCFNLIGEGLTDALDPKLRK